MKVTKSIDRTKENSIMSHAAVSPEVQCSTPCPQSINTNMHKKYKQKDTLLSVTVPKYSLKNHVFTTLILKGGRFLPCFATSCCWGKPPAIPGRKYFCIGTVVLLQRYFIPQGTRNFPRIWN